MGRYDALDPAVLTEDHQLAGIAVRYMPDWIGLVCLERIGNHLILAAELPAGQHRQREGACPFAARPYPRPLQRLARCNARAPTGLSCHQRLAGCGCRARVRGVEGVGKRDAHPRGIE